MQVTDDPMSDDVLELAEQARLGSRPAREDLAVRCLPDLVRFARSRGSDDPEGLAHTVVTEFLVRLPHLTFNARTDVWAYLYRSCRSRMIDERRRHVPELPAGLTATYDDQRSGHPASPGPEDVVVGRMEMEAVLGDLTGEQQQVLRMRFVDDLSLEEVANRTGRSLTAIKALQRRAVLSAARVALLAGIVVALAAVVVNRPGQSANEVAVPSSAIAADGEADRDSGVDVGDPDRQSRFGAAAEPGTTAPGLSADAPVGTVEPDRPSPTTVSGDTGAEQPTTSRSPDTAPGLSSPSTTTPEVPSTTGPGEPVTTTGPEANSPTVPPAIEPPPVVHSCGEITGTVAELEALGFRVTIGTDDDDVIDLRSDPAPQFVIGGKGDDIIETGDGDDVICGGGGNDVLDGRAGNDFIDGGPGNDTLRGGRGRDTLHGGWGGDHLISGPGGDRLVGGRGADRYTPGNGDDTIVRDQDDL